MAICELRMWILMIRAYLLWERVCCEKREHPYLRGGSGTTTAAAFLQFRMWMLTVLGCWQWELILCEKREQPQFPSSFPKELSSSFIFLMIVFNKRKFYVQLVQIVSRIKQWSAQSRHTVVGLTEGCPGWQDANCPCPKKCPVLAPVDSGHSGPHASVDSGGGQ